MTLVLTMILALLVSLPAGAITLDDLRGLSKAGLSPLVLVELVRLEPPADLPTVEELIALHADGVDDVVIAALVRATAGQRVVPRDWAPAPPVASPPPAVAAHAGTLGPSTSTTVVVNHVPVFVPIIIPAPRHGDGHGRGESVPPTLVVPAGPTLDQGPGFGRFLNDGFIPSPAPSIDQILRGFGATPGR
jgi:hypothetical protein